MLLKVVGCSPHPSVLLMDLFSAFLGNIFRLVLLVVVVDLRVLTIVHIVAGFFLGVEVVVAVLVFVDVIGLVEYVVFSIDDRVLEC